MNLSIASATATTIALPAGKAPELQDRVAGGRLNGSKILSLLLSTEAAAAAAAAESRESMCREKLTGGPARCGGSRCARKTNVSESEKRPRALPFEKKDNSSGHLVLFETEIVSDPLMIQIIDTDGAVNNVAFGG